MRSLALIALPMMFCLCTFPGVQADQRRQNNEQKTTTTIIDRIGVQASEFMSGVGRLVDERIGWLRPDSTKELALMWFALSIGLPWALLSWLKPVLKNGNSLLQILAVTLVTGVALWSGWKIWGRESGVDRFASTLVIVLPVLLIHFHSVAAGMKMDVSEQT